MGDSVLSAYLPLIGDRVAVRQFCAEQNRQSGRHQSASSSSGRRQLLLEQLKAKLKRARSPNESTPRASDGLNTTPKSQHARKDSRTISVGWLSTVGGHLVQVRANRGGGCRNVCLAISATKRDIISAAKTLFFPGGISDLGQASEFGFNLVDVQREIVSDSATIASLYEATRVSGNLTTEPLDTDVHVQSELTL